MEQDLSTPADANSEGAPEQSAPAETQQDGNTQADGSQQDTQEESLSRMALVQARTERELRELRQEMRDKDTKLADLQQAAETLSTLKSSVAKGDYSGVESVLGGSYQQWTNAEVDKPSEEQQAQQAILDRLQALENQNRTAQEKAQASAKVAEEQKKAQALEGRRTYVRDEMVAKAEGESMAYIGAMAAEDRVIQAYDAAHKETGVHPDESKVASAVEAALEKELTQSVKALLKLEKFRKLVQSELQATTNQTQQANTGKQGPGLQLTNEDIAGTVRDGDGVPLDDKQAEARAFAEMDRAISQMR